MKEEICEECIRIIGIAEQAYIYEGRVVCEICDKKNPRLRKTWKVLIYSNLWSPRNPKSLRNRRNLRESRKAIKFPNP
jgi:hypothetical protein